MVASNLNITDISDALEAINEASSITRLVQSMVANIPAQGCFQLNADEATGLLFTLNGVVDRLDKVEAWMGSSE